MNAPVTSFTPYLSGSAPVRIGKVTLIVRDLAKVSDFYQNALGLAVISSDATSARLGAGSETLLELKQDGNARQRSRREAGLFHTAFLLPARSDLAAWIIHASGTGLAVQGASDHLVSEAFYLSDPEGNGIEINTDRPHDDWPINGKSIEMPSEPLDIEAIVKSSDGRTWSGAPAGTIVGHIHLQVGDIAKAEAFYADLLGFDVTYRVPGATFYATGGYHHHVATNVWNSRGSAAVAGIATGLMGFELVAKNDGTYERLVERLKTTSPSDPWGTGINIVKG